MFSKNFFIAGLQTYKHTFNWEGESFLKMIRWKAFYYYNSDSSSDISTVEERYRFITPQYLLQQIELNNFENDILNRKHYKLISEKYQIYDQSVHKYK